MGIQRRQRSLLTWIPESEANIPCMKCKVGTSHRLDNKVRISHRAGNKVRILHRADNKVRSTARISQGAGNTCKARTVRIYRQVSCLRTCCKAPRTDWAACKGPLWPLLKLNWLESSDYSQTASFCPPFVPWLPGTSRAPPRVPSPAAPRPP